MPSRMEIYNFVGGRMTSWNFWSSYLPPHTSVSMARFTGRNLAQPRAALFSPIVANMFMEHLERKLLDTAPEDLKPKLWNMYVDDILEVVKKGSVKKKTHRVSKWIGWLSQHKVHIRSGTRWPVTISRFAVKQDRKWWFEATDIQEAYPHWSVSEL